MTRRPDIRSDAGFTLIEVLVALLIVSLGTLAGLQALDAASRNTYRAEQSQVANAVAQREMERIRDLDYDQIALTTAPVHVSGSNEPRNRVNGSQFALNKDGSNQAAMVINGQGGVTGGTMVTGPESFTNGDVGGSINRFVVWRNDPNCILLCPGTQDFKRVVVAVSIGNTPVGGTRSYQELQADFTDPDDSALSGSLPGGGAEVVAQQFWLSDTRCSNAAGDPARTDITADHAVHDTRQGCAETNKPDAMLTNAPPDPDANDPANPPLYDYANDALLEPVPNTDKGLQFLRQDSNGCAASPSGSSAQMKIHRWVSRPMPLAFVATGKATLELWSRTINDVNVPGKICIYLFSRTEVEVPLLPDLITDLPVADLDNPPNPYFTYTTGVWPNTAWTPLRINLNFPPTTFVLGQKIGLAISVERAGTPQNALQFMYDHPDYASRLEIETLTPID